MEYIDINNDQEGLRIHFKSNDMDLREVGILSTALHRAFNEGFAQGLELSTLMGRQRSYYNQEELLLISLTITSIEYGSLSLKTKTRIHKVLRDLSIGVAASLIASIIWKIGIDAGESAVVDLSQRPEHFYSIDLGPNIVEMVDKLSATGKAWELTIEDEQSGVRVTISSKSGAN